VKIVVVGAGIVGLSTAYALAKRGAEVVVIGDRAPGTGASSNNAGWVVPSLAGPVPAPGIVLKTLGSVLRGSGPVSIRPSLAPSFVRFMWGMLRACNADTYTRSWEATAALGIGTLEAFDAWAADGLAFEMHAGGDLEVFLSREELDAALGGLDRSKRAGFDPQVLTGDEARAMMPQLSAAVVGGVFFPHERRVRPASVIAALVARLRAMGVTFIEGAVNGGGRVADGRPEVRGVFGSVVADAVVIAAGAWSPKVARLFGSRLPIRPGKGYSVDYVPGQLDGGVMLMLAEAHCVLTPMDGSTRVTGMMEFGGLEERAAPSRVRQIREAPLRYLRTWDPDAPSLPPSAGLRPMAPDGNAVIGRLAPHQDIYIASGHAMLGLTLAPRTGEELASMILDGGTPELLRPFSPARFGS
jgi:D-amino-acid dehydrogenase